MAKGKKTEVRGFFDPMIIEKIDADLGKLGNSRSEVVRGIVGDYYKGNLVRASELVPELLTALKKKRDEEEAEELRRKTTGTQQ